MNAQLQAWSAKFAALQKREKVVVTAAVVVAIVMGGYTLWVEPAELKSNALAKELLQQTLEVQGLQAQLVGLRGRVQDPDAAVRKSLEETNRQLVASERALRQYDNVLVAPEKVPQLLQSLIVRHRGLQLLSLQTLPPAPLLAPAKADGKADAKTDGKGDDKPAADKPKAPAVAPMARGANIHKHGIEIRMAGNYLDLLAYVTELEALPQKLLWGNMSLAVTEYPRSELTLTVYTLSLDSTWLVV